MPAQLVRARRDALLERFVEHGEIGVGAVDLAIARVQAPRDEADGEQQHDGVDGEHQPRLLDARDGHRVEVLSRRAERRGVVADGRADELLQLAVDERLVRENGADGVRQHLHVAWHRVDALVAGRA